RGPLERIARALDASLEDAAQGILAVADTAMERALRVISVERGYDPVDFALVAFGGAGGLHVAELVERLGAGKAIVPPDPGLLSAYGMLASPMTREASRTVLLSSGSADADAAIEATLAELEGDARAAMESEGADPDSLVAEQWIDARYRGQSFELGVLAGDWRASFHRAHRERYGYERLDTTVEAVTLRVIVSAPPLSLGKPEAESATAPPRAVPAEVFYRGGRVEAARVRREDLRSGHELEGPVVVQEYSATCWLPPEWRARVDSWGCLHISPRP
ncbi:MAG TPA: hydantoinase/oxoprolinase family protein, partial [Longimicrobiales bacterium]|nr:hydantoinase/oxoprolinase family protein [Longimicrobiales bacterium]